MAAGGGGEGRALHCWAVQYSQPCWALVRYTASSVAHVEMHPTIPALHKHTHNEHRCDVQMFSEYWMWPKPVYLCEMEANTMGLQQYDPQVCYLTWVMRHACWCHDVDSPCVTGTTRRELHECMPYRAVTVVSLAGKTDSPQA